MNSKESLNKPKDLRTPEKGFADNKKLVAKYKQQYLDSQQYNKGKPITPSNEYSSADEIIFRDFNSTLI